MGASAWWGSGWGGGGQGGVGAGASMHTEVHAWQGRVHGRDDHGNDYHSSGSSLPHLHCRCIWRRWWAGWWTPSRTA